MAFLDLQHLEKSFGAVRVVKDFTLGVERGEFISLLGPSGCGKTTVLRMVAGFEAPSAGSVVIDGQDVTRLRPNQRKVGMVFQAYALFPRLAERKHVSGTSLSGGEQEMLSIGRALLTNPKLLVMDEPSEGLAPTVVETLIETIKDLVTRLADAEHAIDTATSR